MKQKRKGTRGITAKEGSGDVGWIVVRQHWEKLAGAKGPEQIFDELIVECAADVKPQRIDWLWNPVVPLSKITTFAGDPDLGKSLTALDVAARKMGFYGALATLPTTAAGTGGDWFAASCRKIWLLR